MNTENTDNQKTAGWIYYDADCRFCVAGARRFGRLLATRGFVLQPLQESCVSEKLGLTLDQLLAEMKLQMADGRVFGGADAYIEISRRFWWAWPFYLLSQISFIRTIWRAIYRVVARNRRCLNGACEIPHRRRWPDFLPLVLLPALAFLLRDFMPAWGFMWALAFAIFAGCKWLTLAEARNSGARFPLSRAMGYLLLWPGMNAKEFADTANAAATPPLAEWLFAIGKTFVGLTLIWIVPRELLPAHPLTAGWTGMVGVVFLLHFGTFHLLSLVWRIYGVEARPLMQWPIAAVSLAEFWGRRWNTAFHELANRYTFRPSQRILGVRAATLGVFVLSGFLHDLLIAVPAGGGYGLPTLYFTIQGLGVLGEHSKLGRRYGLGSGLRGWCFTVLLAAGPAPLLFPPPFIHHVILPMLAAIGAT